MQTFNVIVVGAGPSGSTAAALLARNNVKTLLVDRELFPRDKTCGDAVPADCFKILNELGLDTLNDPDFYWVEQTLIRIAEKSRTITFAEHGNCVVPRYVFDQKLLNHAVSCGTALQHMKVTGLLFDGDQVVGIEGKVGSETQRYYANVVIAADGATSVIARQLGSVGSPTASEAPRGVAIRGYVETCVDLGGTLEFDYLERLPSGYAWLFPMGKRMANVGLGVGVRTYKRLGLSLEEELHNYLNHPELRERIAIGSLRDVKSWSLPTFSPTLKRVFNGAILVGDAGGFASPLTGDGIYTGMATGKAAAEAAIHALTVGNFTEETLSIYTPAWHSVFGERLMLEAKIKGLTTVFPGMLWAIICNEDIATPK